MAAFLDNCRFNPTLGGTTDWTYSSAVAGYQSPTLAGAVTTTVYEVFAIDASNNWEIARGACTITTGIPTFARTTVLSNSAGTGTAAGQSGAGTKISFAAAPQVAVVAIKESLISVEEANSFTTPQQGRALANIGAAQFSLINGKLVESHASSIVTFAVKTFAGNDPSASDPVSVIFSDGTQALLTAALSVNSLNTSGTFGTTSGVPFRLWLCLFNNAGTIQLGIRNCSDAAGVYGFPGDGIGSSSGGNANAGQTWTGTTVTSKQFVIVGFADYDSGVTTAGTYAVSPTRIQLFGHHNKKPGDVVSEYSLTSTPAFSTTSSTPATTGLSKAITPTSLYSVFKVSSAIHINSPQQGIAGVATLNRSGTAIGNSGQLFQNAGSTIQSSVPLSAVDRPATTSSVTYAVFGSASAVGTAVVFGGQVSTLTIAEVMG